MSLHRLQRQLVAALRAKMNGEAAPVPEAGKLLLAMFRELSEARTYSASGPNPIQWTEIEAWARLRRWPLSQQHLDIIRAMDLAWLEEARGEKPTKLPEATPAMLDGMLARVENRSDPR